MIHVDDLPPGSWGIDETSLWIFSRSPLVFAVRAFAVVEDSVEGVDFGLPFRLLDDVPDGSLSVVADGVEYDCRVCIGGSSLAFVVVGLASEPMACGILFRGDVASGAGVPDGSGGGFEFSFVNKQRYII